MGPVNNKHKGRAVISMRNHAGYEPSEVSCRLTLFANPLAIDDTLF